MPPAARPSRAGPPAEARMPAIPRAGPGAPAAGGLGRPRFRGRGGAPRCSGLAPASPAPRRSEGAGLGRSMSGRGLGSPGRGASSRRWTRASTGASTPVVFATAPGRRGAAAAASAPHGEPEAPSEVAQEAPSSSAMLRFPQRRCPRRARVGRDPAPGESGRPPRRGAQGRRPSSSPQADPAALACGLAREARRGKMSPLGARSFARGSAMGQQAARGAPALPTDGSRGSIAARRGQQAADVDGARPEVSALPCVEPSRDPGISPSQSRALGPV